MVIPVSNFKKAVCKLWSLYWMKCWISFLEDGRYLGWSSHRYNETKFLPKLLLLLLCMLSWLFGLERLFWHAHYWWLNFVLLLSYFYIFFQGFSKLPIMENLNLKKQMWVVLLVVVFVLLVFVLSFELVEEADNCQDYIWNTCIAKCEILPLTHYINHG